MPNRIFEMGLRASDLAVYGYLCRRAGSKGACWPEVRTIVKACRLDKGTVSAALKRLEAHGIIGRARRFNDSTIYRMLPVAEWPAPKEGNA